MIYWNIHTHIYTCIYIYMHSLYIIKSTLMHTHGVSMTTCSEYFPWHFPCSGVQLLPLLCQDPAVLWDFLVTMPVEPHPQGACATVRRATSLTLPTTEPVKVSHLGHTCWVCATVHRATKKMSVAPVKVSLTGHTHRVCVLLHTG